ncbi:serine peptidase [Burkholderia sp. WAC0059]|uniref:DegQ family serine endoprotease n=1 Tax=Burkholderia sp. WAC0059 TaxID=2066022 RepID=UPI000C7ED934|nr:DegQ family serine endoprotease [Burkholderia sp. WAC0059]PLZ02499.1 serine peptidase [Burkholderia sp. WAC0059]
MTIFPVRKFLAAVAMAACLPFASLDASAAPAANLPDFTDLVDKVGPAVVNIRTTTRVSSDQPGGLPSGSDDGDMSEFFRRFFGIPLPQGQQGQGPQGQQDVPPPDDSSPDNGGDNGDNGGGGEQSSGVGSGFILSSDGYVMTNAHVVDGADNIYVTLTDKREFKARLIGVDDRTDVAVVKIDASNLPVVTIGDSNKVRVGEWVVAIGSPFGLENTVTAGIVSAKGRDTGDYLPFIQTDVAVNPGNSGGPLIDMDGEVIGINSQIYSRTGGFMGISFAIPIDEAMRVADQLETTGRVIRGRIAVAVGEVTSDVADSLGLPRAEGALVSSVEPDGPAGQAGVLPGDIILKFNGQTVDAATDLPRMVGDTKPGTQATITVWRKGQTRDLTVTVAEIQSGKSAKTGQKKPPAPAPRASNALGLAVSDLSADQLKALKLHGGVQVVAVEGPAARVGLQKGDVILRVGDTDITSARQFEAVTARLDPQKMVALLVQRGGNAQFVPLRPRASEQKN